jgi:hypothetical protein
MRQTELPLRLERSMIKLLDGTTMTRDASLRVQLFLVSVERALGNGNLLEGQRKLRSIIDKVIDQLSER